MEFLDREEELGRLERLAHTGGVGCHMGEEADR